MKLPLQITFKEMDPSPAIEARIRERAQKLDRFYDRIMSCRVVVEAPHRHHQKGNLYHVAVDLTVPRGEIVANRKDERNHAHEDVHVAIRDAFAAALRQLEDYGRKQRGEVKSHETPEQGRIARVYAYEGYGFIESADGLEVYFHQNALVDGKLDALEIGEPVRFVRSDAESEKGPQATTVQLLGKHLLARELSSTG
jgi:cold shock CspA family protein